MEYGRLDEGAEKHEAVVLMATPCPCMAKGTSGTRNILQGLDSRQPMTAREGLKGGFYSAMTEKKSP